MIEGLIIGLGLIIVSFGLGAWVVFAMDLLSGDLDKENTNKENKKNEDV